MSRTVASSELRITTCLYQWCSAARAGRRCYAQQRSRVTGQWLCAVVQRTAVPYRRAQSRRAGATSSVRPSVCRLSVTLKHRAKTLGREEVLCSVRSWVTYLLLWRRAGATSSTTPQDKCRQEHECSQQHDQPQHTDHEPAICTDTVTNITTHLACTVTFFSVFSCISRR